ncbi:hypothetical protein KAU33_04670 [Candidatus Dependentiae bacterium]|nr:hypothetical protein [Candidatus Dependentiae bacterium]
MIDKLIKYFKISFKFTNENWIIILIYLLVSLVVPIFIFLLIGLNVILALLSIGLISNFGSDPLNIGIIAVVGFFVIIFDILFFSAIILFFSAVFTGIRASIKELIKTEVKPNFDLVFNNFKYFLKRSLKLSFSFLVIKLGLLLIFLTIEGFVAGVFFFLRSLGEAPSIISIIVGLIIGLLGFITYLIFIIAIVYMSFWKKTSDTQMVLEDSEWNEAFFKGRTTLHENWKIILLEYFAIVIITMVIMYGIQMPIAMLSMIPIIGVLFGMISWIVQMTWTTYIAIFDTVVYLLILGDINKKINLEKLENKYLQETKEN